MDKQLEKDVLISVAMQIILHAGEGRTKIESALQKAKSWHFNHARKDIQEAQACIRLAHKSQTKIIQEETRGSTYPPNLLFNHAQDTLMTIMSELKLAIELIDILEIIHKKIDKQEVV